MSSPYTQLAGGVTVDLLEPDYSNIPSYVFYEALAYTNRFNGNAKGYSVLQHECHVYDYLRNMGASRSVCRAGLVHDHHEAVIGDITTPVKLALQELSPTVLMASVGVLDYRHQAQIDKRWHVNTSHADVKRADRVLCVSEAEKFLGPLKGPAWPSTTERFNIGAVWSPDEAIVNWVRRMEQVKL